MLVVFGLLANRTQNALSTLRDETWRTDCPQIKNRVVYKSSLSVKTRRLNLSQDFCGNFGEPGTAQHTFYRLITITCLLATLVTALITFYPPSRLAVRSFYVCLVAWYFIWRLARNLHTGTRQNVRGEHLHPE